MKTKEILEKCASEKTKKGIEKWTIKKKYVVRVYLAGHILGEEIKKDSQSRRMNLRIAQLLERKCRFEVFLPQRDNPLGVMHNDSQGWEMALVDRRMIELADLIFAVGGFGKDTSWEIGYASGVRPIILYLPNAEVARYHEKDWMLLTGISVIIGPSEACEIMRSSVSIFPGIKILELNDLSELHSAIMTIFEDSTALCLPMLFANDGVQGVL